MESGGVSGWPRRRNSQRIQRNVRLQIGRLASLLRLIRHDLALLHVRNQRCAIRGVPGSQFWSGEFQNHGIHAKAVAWPGIDLFHSAVDLGAQHVLHFHGFDDGDGLASLDLLTFLHGNRDDQTRHWTQHLLPRVGSLLWRHQSGIAGLPLGIDEGPRLVAAITQCKTVRDRAYLHRQRLVVDRPVPHDVTGSPARAEFSGFGMAETHVDSIVRAPYLKLNLALAKPDCSLTLARDRAAAQLARDTTLALP